LYPWYEYDDYWFDYASRFSVQVGRYALFLFIDPSFLPNGNFGVFVFYRSSFSSTLACFWTLSICTVFWILILFAEKMPLKFRITFYFYYYTHCFYPALRSQFHSLDLLLPFLITLRSNIWLFSRNVYHIGAVCEFSPRNRMVPLQVFFFCIFMTLFHAWLVAKIVVEASFFPIIYLIWFFNPGVFFNLPKIKCQLVLVHDLMQFPFFNLEKWIQGLLLPGLQIGTSLKKVGLDSYECWPACYSFLLV